MTKSCLSSIKNINDWIMRSGKIHSSINLINKKLYSDKIYLRAKDPFEVKYQFLVNKYGAVDFKLGNFYKSFIEYLNDMNDIYKNIEEDNPNKERKILIVFGDLIADMISNKRLNPIIFEISIRGKKLSSFLGFMKQSYFAVPLSKIIRLNSTHYFIIKFQTKESF